MGAQKKREFGPSTLRLFSLLARLKWLRGTAFDLFGKTAERRAERALVTEYETDVSFALSCIEDVPVHLLRALLTSVDQIRGFGPVKELAIREHAERRAGLLKEIDNKSQNKIAAE